MPTDDRAIPWTVASVADVRRETPTAHTLVLDVDGWRGHRAGQHVDVRLTAEDGYTAQRSYSLASEPTPARDGTTRLEITVQSVPDGEVSSYLIGHVTAGDRLEIRGPIGRWFVWPPPPTTDTAASPVLLVGGGSGIVPLRAMMRARGDSGIPFRVVYSVREPDEIYYATDFEHPAAGIEVATLFTRRAPRGAERPGSAVRRPLGRITVDDIDAFGWPASTSPHCYVCGPTGFVDTVADLLVDRGHSPSRIRTERFGPS